MNHAKMFLVFIYFGFLCLSGGSSLLQFYIDELVNAREWMTLEELGNLVAISQVTPGPIGVNLATFIGYRHGGFWGGLLCTVGLLIPSFFLMSLAVKSYERWERSHLVRSLMYGIKPITASLILTALFACFGMSIFTNEIPFDWALHCLWGETPPFPQDFSFRPWTLPLLLFSVWALFSRKLSIMQVILLSALYGAVVNVLFS